MIEIWRDVKNYEGLYRVSNLGRIKSLHYGRELILKQSNNFGYENVFLSKGGKSLYKKVHRLVASAFISNPHNYPWCGHENDCKWDNRADNLYWTTAEENSVHNGINLKKKQMKPRTQKRYIDMTREEIQRVKWLEAKMPGSNAPRQMMYAIKARKSIN